MCTVSFIPKQRGFYLSMNRDEKRERATALAPAIVDVAERRAIFPREPTGGTWITANDAGVCVALINWHRIEREPAGAIVSRGKVAKILAGKSSTREIAEAIAGLPLPKLRPFRVITVVPSEGQVTEWRWNAERLVARRHPWRAQHWFSSGFDERKAERDRRRVCARARNRQLIQSIGGLRRLHRSHAPKRGPFSICMHRADAATVSYTEVAVTDQSVAMCYKDGPPCSARSPVRKALPLRL
jgi:transport and Golgi organization protein 2